MGIMRKMGKADPATGKKGASADRRVKDAGKGPSTSATRGKVPPGRMPSVPRGGGSKVATGGRRWGRKKAAATPPPRGLRKLFGSLTGKR